MKNMTSKMFMSAVLVLSLCGLSSAQTPLVEGDRIVFLGDSITQAGVGPGGYVTVTDQTLKALYPDLHLSVIGAGISGHRVPDCQARLQRDVLNHKPTIVVIYIGINDVWHSTSGRGTSKEDFKTGLLSMIKQINDIGARVIMCTPTVIGEKTGGANGLDAMLDEYSEISRSVARETNSQLLDLRRKCMDYLDKHNKENAERGILTSDSVHLSALGNNFLAGLMLEALGVPSKIASSIWYPTPKFDLTGATAFTTQTECDFVKDKTEGKIHYTLDGKEPTQKSPRYTGPIPIKKTTVVKAIFFDDDGNQSIVVRQKFTKVAPISWQGKTLEPGLDYTYYEGTWGNVPDFASVTPVTSGKVSRITLAPRKRDDNFAFVYSGFINIEQSGAYSFFTVSDDGSLLFIDGALVVNNDGMHGAVERGGSLRLDAGPHAIRAVFCEVSGGEVMDVLYEGPGIPKQEIPDTALFRAAR